MTRTYRFRGCEAQVNYLSGYTETRFPDGTTVPAMPHTTPEYRATAARLGYGSDVAMLSREHELLHTWLMERLGCPYSPTLWAVAHAFETGTASRNWQLHEESLVCEFQRVLNTPALARLLPACIHRDGLVGERWINWIDLRKQAWRLLREPEAQGGNGWRAPRRC